ncbi:MAG: acyl-CoA carboxylase subunit beta [Planctomycetota bacterium]|jgi:3-methylcrotonyl-CoA carboxylase beta subunit|nr:acyl-CoA carboxylase subunit beta [Planctomycetota bacterium]
MARITSQYIAKDKAAKAARNVYAQLLKLYAKQMAELEKGGGKKAVAKQHAKGRLSVRERIELLIDKDTDLLEFGLFAAWEMYEEWGEVPAAGVVTGLGTVQGRTFVIIANDATVKAGAFFPMTCKKVIRAQRIAIENRLPVIYLVDSAGVFLPLQEEVFPDEDDFGRVFRHNAVLSAMGVPQLAAIMGSCVAGGAYLPVMCDTILMTEGSGMFLAGPALVKAAIGQEANPEELGGASMHSQTSGTVDFQEPDDPSCISRIRSLVDRFGPPPDAVFDRRRPREPRLDVNELAGLVSVDGKKAYDVREVIGRLVDDSDFDEYRENYGKTLVTGFARIGGWSVGIVANQRLNATNKKRGVEFGGVIYVESSEKATRFIMDCNQNRIPLVFLHDVNGFMVGVESEQAGIIRAGAKMVNAVSNSVVPKLSVILGGSFGAGHYAMCGKAYDPRFIFAWPSARYAVMSGDAAAKVLVQIREAQMVKDGQEIDEETHKKLMRDTKKRYTKALDPRHAAARLWVDAIIRPQDTRTVLIRALSAAAHNTELPPFRTGVLQA